MSVGAPTDGRATSTSTPPARTSPSSGRVQAVVALGALVVVAMSVRTFVFMQPGLDYAVDASASIDAVVELDWDKFVANQPLMGSFSLLLRAVFVAPVFRDPLATVFYAGSIPCVLAALILGLALSRVLFARGASRGAQLLVVVLVVANPLTFRALHWGHPEELLAGALCAGAVLAALRDRELLAGLLLGLALATKQWTVLAILPVLLAAGGRRVAMLVIAGTVAAALTLPLLLGDGDRFGAIASSAAGQEVGGAWTTPWSVWWILADLQRGPASGVYVSPAWVANIAHPLIVLLAIPLSGLLWLRRDRRRDDALLLLTLLLLLRCVLDNWNNDYYHVPFLLALLSWEAVRRPGLPRLTVAVSLLLGVSFFRQQIAVFGGSLDGAPRFFVIYMAWTLPLIAALAVELYGPGRLGRVAGRLRERTPWSAGVGAAAREQQRAA